MKKLEPFPDPQKLELDSVNFHGVAPYKNTLNANPLIGAQKYYGLNNAKYFRQRGYHPGDRWGQLGMPS